METLPATQENIERLQAIIAKQEERLSGIANLGDGTVFVKTTPQGKIQSVKGAVVLREELGELAVIENKVMVAASGFNKLNQVAGVSIITPKTLTLPEGNIVVNPYPIIDPVSKTIEKVWVKKMAVGYSPIGNMVITSSTLLYDTTAYFMQDLAKKVQFSKDAGKICMKSMLTEEELEKGVFHCIQGELGVWADYNHKDILKALNTFIQNKLFAERKAQTICERNVLKKHPSLGIANVVAQGEEKRHYAKIPVIGWCHDLSEQELMEIAEKAEKGEEIEVEGKSVDYIDAGSGYSEDDIESSREEDEENTGRSDQDEGGPRF